MFQTNPLARNPQLTTDPLSHVVRLCTSSQFSIDGDGILWENSVFLLSHHIVMIKSCHGEANDGRAAAETGWTKTIFTSRHLSKDHVLKTRL